MGRFEIYRGKDQKWYWRYVAKNGKITADGSQGYTRKGSCENALQSFLGSARGGIKIKFLD